MNPRKRKIFVKLSGQKIKNKLRKSKVSLGSWITMSDPIVSEIMALSGFDWLAIDIEHSALSLQEVQNHVRTIELSGVTSLVRVGENDANLIKRVMDTGTSGVIVPMVNSRQEAENVVRAVRYPPQGIRGVGLARAQSYGLDFKSYRNQLMKDSIIVIQIEHIRAVDNIEEILQVEGIDAFIVGPYDLSASLGVPGEFDHPQVRKACRTIMEVAKRFKKTAGFHVIPPDAQVLTRKIKEGYKFLGFSLDALYLRKICRQEITQVRASIRRK